MLIHLLVSLCIGALCGFAANKIMNGSSQGFLRNALLGIVGGLVGGFSGNQANGNTSTVSNTAKADLTIKGDSNATAVMSSNSVGCSPLSAVSSSACWRTNCVTSHKVS